MGNWLVREEIRVLTMRNLALRDEIAHLDRRLDDLERWKDRMRENILESNRRLQRIRDELMRDERGFSNFVQGELGQCVICLKESVTNYHQCNLCHNTWCLTCQGRLDNCPYCRN